MPDFFDGEDDRSTRYRIRTTKKNRIEDAVDLEVKKKLREWLRNHEQEYRERIKRKNTIATLELEDETWSMDSQTNRTDSSTNTA